MFQGLSSEASTENEQIILATAGYDHTIKIWQTHTGICQRTMQHVDSQVNMLEITPDKQLLAAAGYQHINMFDLTVNNPIAILNYEATKNVTCVGFQSDSKWMFSGGEDGKVRIWDLRTNKSLHHFEVFAPITSVQLHPNETELFIGDQKGNIHIWDMKTDNSHQYIPDGENMILDVAIDPDGAQLAAVNSKGKCFVWQISGGLDDERTSIHPKHKFDAHSRQVLRCKFSADSKLLVTTSADQTAKIWDTTSFGSHNSLVQELKHENQRWVWDAAFSSDSQYIFTGSSDNVARLWNVKSAKLEREYTGHQKAITTLAFRDVTA